LAVITSHNLFYASKRSIELLCFTPPEKYDEFILKFHLRN
jgi:hypothetical protein